MLETRGNEDRDLFIQPKSMNVKQVFKQFTAVRIDQDVSKSDFMMRW